MTVLQYRAELDGIVDKGCENPDCDCKGGPLYFHSQCHPDAGCWPVYFQGVLRCVCVICDKQVLAVRVVFDGEVK